MTRREPPQIATWMLEHMTSGVRDEALAGDLLETFQRGRSDGWYWQQAIGACLVSWFESLRARASMLVFVILWTIMAPAWNVFCQNVESGKFSTNLAAELISRFGGPVWPLVALVGWILLHAVFLWSGMLIFSVAHTRTGGSLYRDKYKRAFILAPVIFVPAYGVLSLLIGLNWYGYFANFPLLNSPLGQIADFRVLADAIRLPYLLALVSSLWRAIPVSSRALEAANIGSGANASHEHSGVLAMASPESFHLKRFFVVMVGAGLMNALIAGFLLCRLPDAHAPTLTLLCVRAGFYVLAGVLAGICGTYLYWKNPASPFSVREPLPFGVFVLTCARGWVWVPAMVILSEQLSPATAAIATIGALALTSGVRRISFGVFAADPHPDPTAKQSRANLFVESLYLPYVEPYGYVIAICLYAGGAALFTRSHHTAAMLLAFAAAVFAWKKTIPQSTGFDWGKERKRAVLRLAAFAIPALLVTAWALLDGVAHRNHLAAVSAAVRADAGDKDAGDSAEEPQRDKTAVGSSGYESVILWPSLKKEPITPPISVENNLLAPGTKEPLIIHFNGPYWYLQPPNKIPGRRAHLAKGTPLALDIHSSNSVALVMDAHEYLSAAIPISRCREITVEVANRDNTIGAISAGVLLTDGSSTKTPTLYLGEQPIISAQIGHFSIKSAPVFETLHFSIPPDVKLKKFNEITVLILPDVEHQFDAPKIAIEQFELFPR
jgi:hypothetical protein